MTRHTKILRGFTLSALAVATAAGCLVSARNDAATVSVVLDEMPAGLSCVRIKTETSGQDWRLYDVAAGARPVSFELTGLPEGAGTLGVEGYDSACRAVAPFAAPRWTAPSQRLPESSVAATLHFAMIEARSARGATTELPGGIVVTFSSIAGATSTTDGGVTAGDPASGGAEGGVLDGGIIDGDGGATVTGTGGGSEGGTVADGDAGLGTSTSTTTCFGAICVTLTGPPTGDAGLPAPDGGTSGGSTGVCLGRICFVRRLADGGVPPGATCLGPICTVAAPVSGGDGGFSGDAGATGPTQVCLGTVCAQVFPRTSGDASIEGDAGFPEADGGSTNGTCGGAICVFRPPPDPDAGMVSGGTQPVEVCGPSACVEIQRQGDPDGGVAGGAPGGSTSLASVCFGPSCVTLSFGSGGGGGDAGIP